MRRAFAGTTRTAGSQRVDARVPRASAGSVRALPAASSHGLEVPAGSRLCVLVPGIVCVSSCFSVPCGHFERRAQCPDRARRRRRGRCSRASNTFSVWLCWWPCAPPRSRRPQNTRGWLSVRALELVTAFGALSQLQGSRSRHLWPRASRREGNRSLERAARAGQHGHLLAIVNRQPSTRRVPATAASEACE